MNDKGRKRSSNENISPRSKKSKPDSDRFVTDKHCQKGEAGTDPHCQNSLIFAGASAAQSPLQRRSFTNDTANSLRTTQEVIILDEPSLPEAYPAADPRSDTGSEAVTNSEFVNGFSGKLLMPNMTSFITNTGSIATQTSHSINVKSTDNCEKLQELLQAFSSATASMVSSKLQKEYAEQRLYELEREVSANAEHLHGIDKSALFVRQTSSPTPYSINEVQNKLKDCKYSYEHCEKEHVRALQELATEITAKCYGDTDKGSVERLEKRILDCTLEMRTKDETIKTLTETLLRLKCDFTKLWNELQAIKSDMPSFIRQQQQHHTSKNSIHDDDTLTSSRLSLIEKKQTQLEEQTNLLRDDFEDFRVIETEKFANVSTYDNLRMNVNILSDKVENLAITQHKRLALSLQEDEDMSEKVAKLVIGHDQLKGELKLIQDQTKEKEDFHLERMDDMLAELDDLRNILHNSYPDRNTIVSHSTDEIGSELNAPESRIKEICNTCAELSCKIKQLQSDISSLSSSNPPLNSNAHLQEQNLADPHTLIQLREDVERNGKQSDVLSVAIQSLEKRFNNLTTEEMVDFMVKRVRHLYPNVASAEKKFTGILKRLNAIEAKAEETKVSAKDGIAKTQKDIYSIRKNYGDVQTRMNAFDERVMKLEGAHNTSRPNTMNRKQQGHRDDNHNTDKKFINNKNGKIPKHNIDIPVVRNGYLPAPSSSGARISGTTLTTTGSVMPTSLGTAATEEKLATIVSEQSRQHTLLIRILKSNMALKMAVNALNAHTRLKTVDWEAMEELKDLKGMKSQKD